MSYTIPEEILGVPLFVPTGNDFFAIETGGLPNGHNCLKMLGATNRRYMAYQDVQTVTNNIFTARNAGDFAISFWVKMPALSAGTGINSAQTMFGVMNAAANDNWGSAGSNQSYGPAWDHLWSVCHYAPFSSAYAGVGWARTRQGVSPAGVAVQSCATTFTANVWTLVVINCPTSAACSIGINMDNDFVAGGGADTTAGVAISAGMKFCIGSYSTQSSQNGRDQDWYMGKLAFHDHILNTTEKAILYRSMMG